MNEDDGRPLAWNQLRDTLRLLAAPAETQLTAYPAFVPTANELVLEFEDFFVLLEKVGATRLSPTVWDCLSAIDRHTLAMTQLKDDALWTDEALGNRGEWAELRSLAETAIQAFGWTVDPADGELDVTHLSLRPVVLKE